MIYFDNAATTFPKPESVRRSALIAMRSYGSSGRGGHPVAARTSEAVYSAREKIADLFGAEPENTVFTLNCTHALNMAIQGVMGGGGHLIISGMEHNSAARPAFHMADDGIISLSVAQIYPEDERTIESFRSLIRSDTKAVVCTIASNVTGQLMPYREIGRLCREHGICFIADGAQACGIAEIRLGDGINILCTAGHKGLYGMTGTGLLVSDGRFPIKPIIQGGTGNNSQSLEQPELLPESLESGTLAVTGIISLKAGVEFIEKTGLDRIYRHETNMCRMLIESLKNSGVIIYRHPAAEYLPIVSFNVPGIPSERVAAMLGEKGYCLRAGYHCSALAHAALGTETGTVRFSPSAFSRGDDVLRLSRDVREIADKFR